MIVSHDSPHDVQAIHAVRNANEVGVASHARIIGTDAHVRSDHRVDGRVLLARPVRVHVGHDLLDGEGAAT
jgi:hypothetical protein